jgi:hypothetical protein
MIRSLIFFFVISVTCVHAETIEEIAEKAQLASVNTLLIFTSQEGLSSGRYNFTNVGVDMEVYKLPFTYYFEDKEKPVDYFLVGNVGYSRVYISQQVDIPPTSRLNYENHIRTYTAGLGGGVRYKATDDIHFSGGIELIYSRSGASVKKPDDALGDAIEDFFNQEYTDNISYEFLAIAEYKPVIHGYRPYAKASYKLYETTSTFSFNELVSFDTQSAVTILTLGAETPALLNYHKNFLTLEGYLNSNYLSGAVEQSTQVDSYVTLGAVAYWYTPGTPSWAGRFFFEASTVQADGLNGYNIGVGFTADF